MENGICFLLLLTLLINIPFGYLRSPHKKFSFLWFLYIHLPVPAVIGLRMIFNVELTLVLLPFELGVYLLGQFIGKKIYSAVKF